MQHLYVPTSISCPPIDKPLCSATTGIVVPYADALQRVRASCKLHNLVSSANNNRDEGDAFAWLDQDNNSAMVTGKITELSKQTILRCNFLFFRIRMADYRALLNSLAQQSKSESLYSEEKLRKWTHSYRFRLFKGAPIKSALRAFSCRLGIESDPDIVFCRDGFFGDGSAGSIASPTGIPHQMLLGDATAQASGLTNGSTIFVSRSTPQERAAAAAVLRVLDDDPQDAEGEGESQPQTASESPATVSVD